MEKVKLLQIPSTLTSFKSMAKGVLRMTFDTQELVDEEAKSKIIANHEQFGWLTFLVGQKQIEAKDVLDLPELPKPEANKKSNSERLYDVLYVYWKQNGEKGFFVDFYNRYYEKLINSIKGKLKQ